MVYQAVAEYWTNAGKPQYDLDVDILLPDRSTPVKYNFHHDNYFAARTLKVRTPTNKRTWLINVLIPDTFCMCFQPNQEKPSYIS